MDRVTNLAQDLLSMINELEMLRTENARLLLVEDKYNALVSSTFEHQQLMSSRMLELCLNVDQSVLTRMK